MGKLVHIGGACQGVKRGARRRIRGVQRSMSIPMGRGLRAIITKFWLWVIEIYCPSNSGLPSGV
ncbi:MAG: hypothetical protein ACFNLX_02830 [Capnocytophaga granulosa]